MLFDFCQMLNEINRGYLAQKGRKGILKHKGTKELKVLFDRICRMVRVIWIDFLRFSIYSAFGPPAAGSIFLGLGCGGFCFAGRFVFGVMVLGWWAGSIYGEAFDATGVLLGNDGKKVPLSKLGSDLNYSDPFNYSW